MREEPEVRRTGSFDERGSRVEPVIELHGGMVWAESQPGSGSIFYFTLPQVADSVLSARKLKSPFNKINP